MHPSAVIRSQVPKTPGIGRSIPPPTNVTSPVSSASFRRDAPVFEPYQSYPPQQFQQLPMSPALFIPQQTIMTPGYGQPYVYAVPTYYQPMTGQLQPPFFAYNFHNYVKPKKSFFTNSYTPNKGHNSPLFIPPQNGGMGASVLQGVEPVAFSSVAVSAQTNEEVTTIEEVEREEIHLDVHMSARDLYKNILSHLKTNPQCKVSWLNRLLAKCNNANDFHKATKAFLLYQTKLIETTPETGTLLIKAACRAGLPEKALEMLQDIERIRIFPTLGGIHYLMINFSLKRDTKSVVEAFQVTKLRHLEPTTRTYHILIRECVDNGLIDEAMNFSKECQEANIAPNRVTYNILMNGCRKFNKAQEILDLRSQMNQQNIEINDTTVKFTALAYMMLGQVNKAVEAFHEFPELNTKLEEFSLKFFEVMEEENAEQKKCVIDLFNEVEKRTPLPSTVKEKLQALDSQ